MTWNVDEVKHLLQQGDALNRAVNVLANGLETKNTLSQYLIDGITYKSLADGCGFTVTLNGITLLPRYQQIRGSAGSYPKLLAKIELCYPTDQGKCGEVAFLILLDTQGNFSLDGSTEFRYTVAGSPDNSSQFAQYRLSLAIAHALHTKLPIFGA